MSPAQAGVPKRGVLETARACGRRVLMAKPTDGNGGDGALPASMGNAIHVPKLSHLVAARLRDEIVSGQMAAGTMLLPESKLLDFFSVSRPTLREALRILEAESLISIGRGMRAGALVLGPSMRKAAEYTTFMLVSDGVTMRDLHEARMFFEPAIVRSLTGTALADATNHLRGCVESIQSALDQRRYIDVVGGTNRFHEALARASGNKTIALLVGMLRSISDDAYTVVIASDSAATDYNLEKNMKKTVAGYVALCDLLEKGKVEEAASFWRRYMERALQFLKSSGVGDRRIVRRSTAGGATLSDGGPRDTTR